VQFKDRGAARREALAGGEQGFHGPGHKITRSSMVLGHTSGCGKRRFRGHGGGSRRTLGDVRQCGWICHLRHWMLRPRGRHLRGAGRPGRSDLRRNPTRIAELRAREGARQSVPSSMAGSIRRGR
jgi:hypothetical protein